MGKNSDIAWTNHTFNPWWGCEKLSAGCKHCYAAVLAYTQCELKWGAQYRFFGEKHWNEPLVWDRQAKEADERPKVFCASMCDIFQDITTSKLIDAGQAPKALQERKRTFKLIETCTNMDWLLLTKRTKNVLDMVPESWLDNWPEHVWMGTTIEHQDVLKRRVAYLKQIPAPVLFVSAEPLLSGLDFTGHLGPGRGGINWVIAGGESGKNARRMEMSWVRSLREQTSLWGVPFMFKQKVVDGLKIALPELDGRTWNQSPDVESLKKIRAGARPE